MRRYVASVMCVALVLGVAVPLSGCTAKASIGSPPEVAPPPPPATPAPVTPAPEPEKPKRRLKMKFKMKGEQVELPGPVVFETGSDVLKPESDEVLNIVHEYLKETTDITLLRIEGHTDSDGKKDDNQKLSERRAMAVAKWLVAKGDDCKRLLPVGFGQDKPVADNATPEGKAQNRRTAFVNAARNGKPIGGFAVDGGGKDAGNPCK
jgi:OOP family OmpA-OmpF porin